MSFSHALLAKTEKLKVIAAILPGPWKPALAAKQLATIDYLTQGRIAVNVVSGWFRGEFDAIGEPWPEHDERYARSEEFIRTLKGIWTTDNYSFEGKYYQFQNYTLKPKPAQKPYIEVFRKMVRYVVCRTRTLVSVISSRNCIAPLSLSQKRRVFYWSNVFFNCTIGDFISEYVIHCLS